MLRVLLLGFAALCLASANSDLESSILSDLDELLVDADPDIFEDVEEGAGDMSTLDDLGDDLGDDLEVEIRPELREARQKCRDSIPKPDHITPRNEVEQEFLTKAVLGNWYTKPTWQHAYEATMTKACKYWGIKGRLERLEEEFHAAFNQYWQTYDSNPVDAVNTLWQSTKPMYDRINRTRKKLPRSMPTYTKWADSKDSLAQAFKKVWTRLEKAVEWDTPKWPFDVALFEKAFFEAAHKRLLWGKLLEWYNRKRAEWFLRGAACLGQPGSCSQATVQQIIDDLPEIAVYQFRVWGAFYDQAWLLTTSSAIPNLNTDQACCDGFFRQLKEGPGCDVAKILRYSCKTSPACQTSTLNPAARGNQLPWTRSLITTGPRDAWVSPAGRPVDPHQFNGDLAACRKQSMCVQSQEFCFIPTCVASMMMTINGQHGHGFCKAVEMLEKYGTGQNGSSLLETDESEQDEMTACEGCPWPQACEAQFRLDDSSSASSKAKQRQR